MDSVKVPDITTFKAPLQLRDSGLPCDDAEIDAFERATRVVLPSDFRRFLLDHNGGYPKPDCIKLNDDLGFAIREFSQCRDLSSKHFPGVVEFGDGPYGDDFAISCRGFDYGYIYWVNHETCDPDCLSVRLTAAARFVPTSLARGVTFVAKTFTDFIQRLHFDRGGWIRHLLEHDVGRFRNFVEEVGVNFNDEIGTPIVNFVASYGTSADLEWIYSRGARSPDIICRGVRNTRDTVNVVRFLLSKGENAVYGYQPNKPYAMAYAKMHNLTDVVELLKEYGVPDAPAL